jgi:hypothetical protein
MKYTTRFLVLHDREKRAVARGFASAPGPPTGLDTRGLILIPIRIPNTVDTLKIFVEGSFFAGVGSMVCIVNTGTEQVETLFGRNLTRASLD